MKRWVLALALAFGQAAVACAQDSDADWLKRPTAEDLAAVWPREAWQKGLGGKVILACQVSLQGALFDCQVGSETPEGAGFGRAALALAPQLLMKPAVRNGKPVVSQVQVPINFRTPDIALGSRIPGSGPYQAATRTALVGVAWQSAPSYPDVVAAYPEEAKAKGVGGRVTLTCVFKGEGRLAGCQTVNEEPERLGFARAAKSLSDSFVGPTTLSDGRKTAGILTQISFTFAPEMLDPDPRKRVVGKPVWAVTPSADQFAGGYPDAAKQAGVATGRAVLLCDIAAGGRLDGCSTQSEEPDGFGFGDAALALSEGFRLRIWTVEGLPVVGGKLRVPIRYNAPQPAPASAATGAP